MYAQDNFLGYTWAGLFWLVISPLLRSMSTFYPTKSFFSLFLFVVSVGHVFFCSRFPFRQQREGRQHRAETTRPLKNVSTADRTLVSEKPLTSRRKSYYADKTCCQVEFIRVDLLLDHARWEAFFLWYAFPAYSACSDKKITAEKSGRVAWNCVLRQFKEDAFMQNYCVGMRDRFAWIYIFALRTK